jgi:hypothetical protein
LTIALAAALVVIAVLAAVGYGPQLVERLRALLPRLDVQRVQLVGSVDREYRDAVAAFEQESFVGCHRYSSEEG